MVPRRDELKPGEIPCTYCIGKCCRYFALPLAEPTTWQDFDDIRWYLAHEKVSVFVDDGTWFLMVHNRCRHLDTANRCDLYQRRPTICRNYSPDACEYEDDFLYDKLFEHDEQLLEYAEMLLGPHPQFSHQANLPILPLLACEQTVRPT